MTYIPALLQRTKQLFLSLFQPYLESLIDALSDRAGVLVADSGRSALRILADKIAEERWDRIFERCLKTQENSSGRSNRAVTRSVTAAAAAAAATGASCELTHFLHQLTHTQLLGCRMMPRTLSLPRRLQRTLQHSRPA